MKCKPNAFSTSLMILAYLLSGVAALGLQLHLPMVSSSFPLIGNNAATPSNSSMTPLVQQGTRDKHCLASKTTFP